MARLWTRAPILQTWSPRIGALPSPYGPWATQFFPEASWNSRSIPGRHQELKVAIVQPHEAAGRGKSGTDTGASPSRTFRLFGTRSLLRSRQEQIFIAH